MGESSRFRFEPEDDEDDDDQQQHGRHARLVPLDRGGTGADRSGDDARPSGGGMRGRNYEVSVPTSGYRPFPCRCSAERERIHKLTISFAPERRPQAETGRGGNTREQDTTTVGAAEEGGR